MQDRHIRALAQLKKGTVIPANPLCLDKNRRFNPEGQRLLSRYYLESGSGGLAVGVHTTQFEIRLSQYNLLEPVLRSAAEEMDRFEGETGNVVVRVGGVCGPKDQAFREVELCRKLGYDAVLLSPGGLAELSEEDLLRRTEAVAECLPVIGFYLQDAVGGRRLSYDYWHALAEIPGVAAIKCASFNRYTTVDVMRAVAFSSRWQDIALYTGNDDNIVVDLLTPYRFQVSGEERELRFVGGLLGHWSVWTRKAVELFHRIRELDGKETVPAELLTLAAQITDANAALFDAANRFKGCIAGLHEILRRQGLMEGIWCLDPEESLSPGQMEEIDRVCAMYPHLLDDDFIRSHLAQWKQM